MIVVLKGIFWEFDISINKYSNFESRQFQTRLGLALLATV